MACGARLLARSYARTPTLADLGRAVTCLSTDLLGRSIVLVTRPHSTPCVRTIAFVARPRLCVYVCVCVCAYRHIHIVCVCVCVQ